jgi:uncharacterized protein DUF3568
MARKRKMTTDSRPLADRNASAVASRRQHRRILAPLLLAACLQLQGCVAVGVTMAGLGFTNQLGGIQYRTFTEPLPRVSRATVTAFKRMAINVEAVENTKEGQVLRGTASDRNFEVALEAITPNTTRMRSIAKNHVGVIVDASTALEIIRQAEKALELETAKKRS